jgi:hypothetical protein
MITGQGAVRCITRRGSRRNIGTDAAMAGPSQISTAPVMVAPGGSTQSWRSRGSRARPLIGRLASCKPRKSQRRSRVEPSRAKAPPTLRPPEPVARIMESAVARPARLEEASSLAGFCRRLTGIHQLLDGLCQSRRVGRHHASDGCSHGAAGNYQGTAPWRLRLPSPTST